MLQVLGLNKFFGGLKAVRDCSLEIAEGTITGLIGPNGAGKTTLFSLIAGEQAPTSGRIVFEGEDITGLPTHQMFHRGIVRTFQIPHEFAKLTVLENLMVVPPRQPGEHIFNNWFAAARVRSREAEVRERAEAALEFLSIAHLRDERAGNLSGGQYVFAHHDIYVLEKARNLKLEEHQESFNESTFIF